MSPDEQEALSHCHSHGLWVVPLPSGNIAVWDHPSRSLRCIITDAFQLVELSHMLAQERKSKANAPRQLTLDVGEGLNLVINL